MEHKCGKALAFVSNKGYKTAIWAKQKYFIYRFCTIGHFNCKKNVKRKGKQDSK